MPALAGDLLLEVNASSLSPHFPTYFLRKPVLTCRTGGGTQLSLPSWSPGWHGKFARTQAWGPHSPYRNRRNSIHGPNRKGIIHKAVEWAVGMLWGVGKMVTRI
jgi:hypothetical protein